MGHLVTWFSGQLGAVRLMVGLNDLEDLVQPKWFYDLPAIILAVIMCAVLLSVLEVNMEAA